MSAPRSRKLTQAEQDRREHVEFQLRGAKAATMTAILALEGKGVDGDVADSLRLHVLHPLNAALKEVTP